MRNHLVQNKRKDDQQARLPLENRQAEQTRKLEVGKSEVSNLKINHSKTYGQKKH